MFLIFLRAGWSQSATRACTASNRQSTLTIDLENKKIVSWQGCNPSSHQTRTLNLCIGGERRCHTALIDSDPFNSYFSKVKNYNTQIWGIILVLSKIFSRCSTKGSWITMAGYRKVSNRLVFQPKQSYSKDKIFHHNHSIEKLIVGRYAHQDSRCCFHSMSLMEPYVPL